MPIEFPTGELETPFLTRPIAARDGWVEVPAGPGLGVEINEEAIRRYPYAAGRRQAVHPAIARAPMTFTERELMVIAAGREIRDGELAFVGMRLPLVAFAFAKRTHAPRRDRPLRERHRARCAGSRDADDHERHAQYPGRALGHRHAPAHGAPPAGRGRPRLHRRRRDRPVRQPEHLLRRRLAAADACGFPEAAAARTSRACRAASSSSCRRRSTASASASTSSPRPASAMAPAGASASACRAAGPPR